MSLSKRDKKSIWHPYTQMKHSSSISIVKGEGIYLYDERGKKYMDAISSWWVNIHGHSHPYIAEKVSAQLKILEHAIFAGFTHQPAIDLAEKLLKILPASQSKIFYSDNGSTAVEVALKMALQYWQNKNQNKLKVIAFEYAYHGDTFGAMSVSERSEFTRPFYSLLFDVIRLPYPAKGKEQQTILSFKEQIKNHKNQIAAFIFEPFVLGAAGMLMYEAPLLNELTELCRANNILIIADEVMTGFGRTGKTFASEFMAHQPDIICLSKALTGGTLPLGVTSCSEEIYNSFLSDDASKTFYHGHSYTANPLACTAAIASYDLLIKDGCRKNISDIGNHHKNFVERLQKEYPDINARCKGTIMAVDFLSPEPTSYHNSLRNKLYNFFLEKGIILRPLGNTIYIMPPYCITANELDYIYLNIEEALKFL